jgi:hypothetical protein
MPLAAPLILPFAELAGITIAGLGMAAASKKVSDFISDNPEISTQILTTLVPGGVGLNALFKKKAKEDSDDESVEVAPEDKTREERAKEMKKRFKEGKGDKREIGKKGFEEVIKPVKDIEDLLEGEERYDGSLEDAPKPKFDYTKFFKADGGRVGYAKGGRGYSDYASPSSTTASQDFATQAVSGGQTDYSGGGGGNDQPITEIRPDFNYNINPFSINPRLNFKNIASIIYLQEFLDKKARGEDADLEADINYNAPFLQSGIGSLAYNTNRGFTAGLSGNLTPNLRGDVSFQDGQQNVNFNYNKGPFSADFTSGPEKNNIQVGFKMPFADGGRIGYVGGGLATTQDFANALKSVSAGTTYQQQIQAKEYARNEASNLLSQAMRSADPNKGPGLQGIYDTFFRTTLSPGIRPKTFTPDSSGRMIMYSARDRDAILDSMANQMLNTTPYADPKASASEAYGKMMQQKTEEAYGTPDKYRAEAMTLGMPVEAYYDYLTTRDDKNIMQQYRKQDPYFEPSTYVPFTEADRTSSPYDIYFQQILQQQIDAGVPEEGRIQSGEVALPSMISPTTTGAAPRPFMSYSDALAQTRQSLGLADGGRVNYQAGGVATPEQYAAALQKVGAGTETQKRTSLGNYLGDYIATQGQKLGNAAVIPFQAAKGVLGIQGTPITDSMQTSLQNIIQNQIKNSGKLSGNINYNDYGVKTNTQGNEFLGFGDRSFTDPEAALATTLGQASYSVDPKTGKITFTGGTAYDFGDDQFGGLGKFISKGGVFNQLPSVSNKFQPGATEYNPDITLGSDFMKQFNQPKYPDYKTAALQSQYYKNNPSNLDSDLFRAAYARALPDSGIKTRITNEGQVATDYGNYDPSRVYSAYMGNTGTSSSNPFFDQFKGSQYADMPTIMEAMYGTPGNINPYYADGQESLL